MPNPQQYGDGFGNFFPTMAEASASYSKLTAAKNTNNNSVPNPAPVSNPTPNPSPSPNSNPAPVNNNPAPVVSVKKNIPMTSSGMDTGTLRWMAGLQEGSSTNINGEGFTKINGKWTRSSDGAVLDTTTGYIGSDTPSATPEANKTIQMTTQGATSTPFALTAGNISQGSTGNDVLQLQRILGIKQDGAFGPATRSAVMAFQEANGLKIDGIVGPQTTAALAKLGSGTYTAPDTSIKTNKPAVIDTSKTTGYKFDPYTGKPITSTETPRATNQGEVINIDNNANQDQEQGLQSILKNVGDDVDVSNSKKLLDALEGSLLSSFVDNTKKPTVSLEEKMATERANLQIDPVETNLNNVDAKIARLDSDWLATQETEDNRVVSMNQINRRKSAEEINYNRTRNQLLIERNSLATQLDSKYKVLDIYMRYAEKDYDEAKADYETKFNQTLKIMDLIKNTQDDQKSAVEKRQDQAKANLTLVVNTLDGKDYSTVDSTTKTSIQKLELEAGLPAGTFEGILRAKNNPKATSGTGTLEERQITTISNYAAKFTTGATLSNGTPVLDDNGFITPVAWKAAIKDAPQYGLTRDKFIEAFGYLVYTDKDGISSAYGLTPNEKLLIQKK